MIVTGKGSGLTGYCEHFSFKCKGLNWEISQKKGTKHNVGMISHYQMGPLTELEASFIIPALKDSLYRLPGLAVIGVKITGISPNPITNKELPGAYEDIVDILVNLKAVKLAGKLENGPIRVGVNLDDSIILASAIETPENIRVLNPDQYIARRCQTAELNRFMALPLSEKQPDVFKAIGPKIGRMKWKLINRAMYHYKGRFYKEPKFKSSFKPAPFGLELIIGQGHGYVLSDELNYQVPTDFFPLDANFSPVRRVQAKLRVLDELSSKDLRELRLTVITTGAITPQEALDHSLSFLLHTWNFMNQSLKDLIKDDSIKKDLFN